MANAPDQVARLAAIGFDGRYLLWACARQLRNLHRKYTPQDVSDMGAMLCDAGYPTVARMLPEMLCMPGEVFAAWEATQGFRTHDGDKPDRLKHAMRNGVIVTQTDRILASVARSTDATLRPAPNRTPAKRYAPELGTPRETLSQECLGAWVKIRGRWTGVPTAPHGTPGPNHSPGRADDHQAIRRQEWTKADMRAQVIARETEKKRAKPYNPPVRMPSRRGKRGKASRLWANVPR